MHPLEPGLSGWLDSPETGALVRDRLTVRGWVFTPGKPVSALVLQLGRRTHALTIGVRREDVMDRFTESHAAESGFEGTVPLGGRGPRSVPFEIWASFDGGALQRCFAGMVFRSRPDPISQGYWRTAAQRAVDAALEGRLRLSPKGWLESLRRLSRQFEAAARRPKTPESAATLVDARESLAQASLARLQAFLDAGARLDFRPRGAARVSVLLVLYNRAELTLDCLRSLTEERTVPFEVVLVDNASTDRTSELLSRLDGTTVLRQPTNAGFLRAVNLAASRASAPYLLLLNNDATLMPGCLPAALAALEGERDIGAVGGKIILVDGTLQEAGSIVWRDGSCLGYGRGAEPTAGEFNFTRDVDYCSGAFLLTRADLFAQFGGFDERYAPAYYEDSDYCVRLWQQGFRTVYEPRAVVQHFEFASSPAREAAIQMQAERQRLFARTHATWLAGQHPPGLDRVVTARSRSRARRLLVIDDQVPHPRTGFGFARAAEMLSALVELGYDVSLFPTNHQPEPWHEIYRDIPRTVEVIVNRGLHGLDAFLAERAGHYHTLVVSRSHNLKWLREGGSADAQNVPVIYDAEAIAAIREVQRRRFAGQTVSAAEEAQQVDAEIDLARSAHTVLTVSEGERQTFVAAGIPRVEFVGHSLDPSPTHTAFADRTGVLFVGAFHELSPNGDAVRWFLEHVWPRFTKLLAEPVTFVVIGPNPPSALRRMAGPDVRIIGAIDDLEPYYSSCRIFVAPTRFAAGMPFKVHHAAAHGLPVVCTTLLADQLGWRAGVDLLATDSPDMFAQHCADLYRDASLWHRIRDAGLARIWTDCSKSAFRDTLDRVIRKALDMPAADRPLTAP